MTVVLIVALWGMLMATSGANPRGDAYADAAGPARFIVKYRTAPRQSAVRGLSALGVQARPLAPATTGANNPWDRIFVMTVDSDTAVSESFIRDLLPGSDIEYIEPDRLVEFFDLPLDPLFRHQWCLRNTGQEYYGIERIDGDFNDRLVLKSGTSGADINLSPLYDSPPVEATRVVVGVVDTGIDLDHPELRSRIWTNVDEIAGNGVDDDHNGYVDDTVGYDVSGDIADLLNIVGDNDPSDMIGHGTHIAGIIGAARDGVGVVGIAPNCLLMPVKIRPNAFNSVAAEGIVYAVDNGADVISISWGTPFEALVLKDAIDYAVERSVTVVVAAGNSGTNARYYPAAFDNVITVAAGNSDGFLTYFSTFGAHIDVVAPGEDILSLRAAGTDLYAEANEPEVRIIGSDSLYYLSDGTSMAAPVVAGAAALIKSTRPDLGIDDLRSLILAGARDLVDPWNQGDDYPGPDTISGWGYLDVAASLDMLATGGVAIVSPDRYARVDGPVEIRAAPVGGYAGEWQLEFMINGEGSWQSLASGQTIPTDSVLATFDPGIVSGRVHLRLTDRNHHESQLTFDAVGDAVITLESPAPGTSFEYTVEVAGSAHGRDYDSLQLLLLDEPAASPEIIYSSPAEFFAEPIHGWSASGIQPGEYTLVLRGFFGPVAVDDSSAVTIESAFASGWPVTLEGIPSLSPAVADLDGDGKREVIAGTSSGLWVLTDDGQVVDGFPVLPDMDMRTVPAIYDIDGDGDHEIICTNRDGLHVYHHDGTHADGWPQKCGTGILAYGFPSPAVVAMSNSNRDRSDSAIVLVNVVGDVLAYHFDGSPYFSALDGLFTAFNPQASAGYYFGGNSATSADLDGDGKYEVVVTFTGIYARSGIGVFDARTARPAFGRALPYVIEANVIWGSLLADLDGDELPEIIAAGYDSTGTRTIWIKTRGTRDLPGWPKRLPELTGWRGSFPVVRDLDLDGHLEVLASFFDFDIGSLYIFRDNGTEYIDLEGRPDGEVFRQAVTFGVPMTADLLGDEHPEILLRTGYLLPGTGPERIYLLDYTGNVLPGWPIVTPAPYRWVFSTPYAPLVDDIDGDGRAEMALINDNADIYVWDMTAPALPENAARLFADNRNSNTLTTRGIVTDVDDHTDVRPTGYSLHQNYPNPFNPVTMIGFELPVRSRVQIDLYNILGRRVTTVLNSELGAGSHVIPLDGTELASGVYFYRLTTGDFVATRKMLLLK